MPTTVAGLILLVALALPGYVFHIGRARASPDRTYSALQEILSILFAGVAVDGIALILMVVITQLTSLPHPDPQRLILDPKTYSARHLELMALWSVAAILLAGALAYAVAPQPWRKAASGRMRTRLQDRTRRLDGQQSAWWLLFHEHPDADIYLGCILLDGSYLAGVLHSYSRVSAEHQDRELTLRGEIVYRAPGETDGAVLPDVNAVIVSARQLSVLTVSYLKPPDVAPLPNPIPPATASATP
jgi:Family of unknown function (DUF6338)